MSIISVAVTLVVGLILGIVAMVNANWLYISLKVMGMSGSLGTGPFKTCISDSFVGKQCRTTGEWYYINLGRNTLQLGQDAHGTAAKACTVVTVVLMAIPLLYCFYVTVSQTSPSRKILTVSGVSLFVAFLVSLGPLIIYPMDYERNYADFLNTVKMTGLIDTNGFVYGYCFFLWAGTSLMCLISTILTFKAKNRLVNWSPQIHNQMTDVRLNNDNMKVNAAPPSYNIVTSAAYGAGSEQHAKSMV